MASVGDDISVEQISTHTFYFPRVNKSVTMTQEQVERIPYLHGLVSHSTYFKCKRNEENAFILTEHFPYDVCYPILSFVIEGKWSHLLEKLPMQSDVLQMFEIYDYFSMNPQPFPSVGLESETSFHKHLSSFIEGYQVDDTKLQKTAMEILLAIANGRYDLNHLKTAEIIFDFLREILTYVQVFGSCFRYHTLIIIENSCRNLFTDDQNALLLAYKRSLQKFSNVLVETSFIDWRKTAISQVERCILRQNYLIDQYPNRYFPLYVPFINDYFYDTLSIGERYPLLFYVPWCSSNRCGRYSVNKGLGQCCRNRLENMFPTITSCPCKFLDEYVVEKCKFHWKCLEDASKHMIALQNDIEGPISRLKICLLQFCRDFNRQKDLGERKLKYSERQYHLMPLSTVDKFKNRPTDKKSESRR